MPSSNDTTQKEPRKLFLILLPILSIVFTLLLIELFLAILHPIPYAIERNMFFEADPYTGYRLKPNSIGTFQQGIPAVVNSHGHRDDEVTLEKPDGVFRVLMLGDSFTVGANVRQEEAYPQVLEERLAERTGRDIQVVNAGVGGWEPFMYAQYYEHYGQYFDPDLILIGFFVGNDAYDQSTTVEQLPTAVWGRRVSRKAAARPLAKLLVLLHEHSHLMRLLTQRGPQALDFTRDDCSDLSEEYLAVQRARINAHLKRDAQQESLAANGVYQIQRIQQLAAGKGIPVIVVLLPDENQINPALQDIILKDDDRARYDFGMPQSMLADLFAARGIPTIDLLPAFLADPRCLYMNDTHWTPEGHRLAAEFIADKAIHAIQKKSRQRS
jgi:lysophospholipase L1-like esterase